MFYPALILSSRRPLFRWCNFLPTCLKLHPQPRSIPRLKVVHLYFRSLRRHHGDDNKYTGEFPSFYFASFNCSVKLFHHLESARQGEYFSPFFSLSSSIYVSLSKVALGPFESSDGIFFPLQRYWEQKLWRIFSPKVLITTN